MQESTHRFRNKPRPPLSEAKKDRNRFYKTEWRKVRAIVLKGEPKLCHICNGSNGPIRYDLKYPHPLSPSVDHIIPASNFDHLPDAQRAIAMYDLNNLAPCHKVCNDTKAGDEPSAPLQCNPGQEW